MNTSTAEELKCIACENSYSFEEVRFQCECGGLLEVKHDAAAWKSVSPTIFQKRQSEPGVTNKSGVWRFREVIANISLNDIVTLQEGDTGLYKHAKVSQYGEVEQLYLKHEGQNPTGSFKDRGMTVAVSKAKSLQRQKIACASTGNTSAALAAYAGSTGMEALVFIPSGKIALGKLSQALGYGAKVIQIDGDFDAAMNLVQQASAQLGLYLVNSLNPYRLEGQKSIIWELLAELNWQAPDWIVVPAGNLGNTSAFGKALTEAHEAGWITKMPHIASVQASGANPFFNSYEQGFNTLNPVKASTIATAIQIGNPVNYSKAKKVIQTTNGVVTQVTDDEILKAKAVIDRVGIGCEPASACSLAGTRKLRRDGIIKDSDTVVGILTGHILKDSEILLKEGGNTIISCAGTMQDLEKVL